MHRLFRGDGLAELQDRLIEIPLLRYLFYSAGNIATLFAVEVSDTTMLNYC